MIMNKLFDDFDRNNIRYIHFKSNTNLHDSFAGKGDFDVLVDKNRLMDIERIIADNNGKRHNPVRFGQYPGVDNWLVFDDETGVIYHLHLHYQLATGKKLLKDYIIPWENILFETRIRDEEYGIYITDPSLELILLSVRSVLKSRLSDWIKARIGLYRLHIDLENERRALLSKTDFSTLEYYLRMLFDEIYIDHLLSIMKQENVNSRNFRKLSKIVRKSMRLNRRYNALRANTESFFNQCIHMKNRIDDMFLGKCRMVKKTCLSGGLIIAFVGVDGSGKSTTTKEISSWMGKKIECKRFYMGAGDGKTTPFVHIMKKLNNMTGERGTHKGNSGKRIFFLKNPIGYIKKFVKMLVIYDVEKNNTKQIKTMQRYRLNGGISLLDRYPQIEMEGRNDGPKIPVYESMIGSTHLTKRLKRNEEKQLSIVKSIKPDIIFRLNISAETSMARKPEQKDISEFQGKIDDLKKITFQNAFIIDIDAEQPYDDELLEIKRILWNYI